MPSWATPQCWDSSGGALVSLRCSPSSARRYRNASKRVVARASGGCSIKGNRNRKGRRICRAPGMPRCDATRAGEVFCTEAGAPGGRPPAGDGPLILCRPYQPAG